MRNILLAGAFGAAVFGAALGSARAEAISVSIVDPGQAFSAYHADITRLVVAAGQEWLSHFGVAPGGSLEVQVQFDAALATAQGASATSAYMGTGGATTVWHQGAAYEIISGIDPNGDGADVLFTIGGGYLQSDLWFDPFGDGAVPGSMIDAYSMFLHEFGHALGFNGWRDGYTGMLPGDYQSSFDALVRLDPASGLLHFEGGHAMAVYGGPVPLSYGNYAHLGNGPGLYGDLMNGMGFEYGVRYSISALDLAVMADLGLTLQGGALSPAPEPAAWALMLAGLLCMGGMRRRRAAQA